MSAEAPTSEFAPRKCLKRKATDPAEYSSRAETAQFGELQGGLPVESPRGGEWNEPHGKALDREVTTGTAATTAAYGAEGTESPAELFWLLLLQAGYTVW